ncbi:S1/P1 nuclease [Thalassoroseus pseudoceratinae]|uniref:S1/P1 nuclease n=1 Tax=Thalassoroseus pseudoceratinae TaxID=2713176 RepID=UPI001423EF0C|nr:S1/P1 nuclease [Thalassoroseus pseudoceratinae]
MRAWFCGFLTLVISWSMTNVEARAWNPSGHQTIASIIFRELSAERRMELAELLTHHPRYRADFLSDLPRFLQDADAETLAEWRFQLASIWSDIVRGGPADRTAFNRPFWHYLPRAYYLSPPTDRFRKQVESGFNSRLEPVGGTENEKLNGPQAFLANLEVLNDDEASKADRAVALCWVLHIGQDLHQPCHTASLCDPVLFPRGDRGANDIKTKQLRNLHAVWDGPLGPDSRFIRCRNLAIQLRGDASKEMVNQDVTDARTQMAVWLSEGLKFAESDVYSGEVRAAVESASPLKTVDLSPDYLRNVRRVANGRIVNAGIRLARLLESNQ